VLGVVDGEAIALPVAIDISPVNDLLADAFGSRFSVGLLSGEWRISLGGVVFNVIESRDTKQAFEQLLPGVPYLRKFGQSTSVFDVNVGGFNLNQPFQSPVNLIFDPADPMLYVRGPGGPGLAVSMHGLLSYRPQLPPEITIPDGATEFSGHVFANVPIPLPTSIAFPDLPEAPLGISAEFVVNVDADRDGKPLGDLGDVADLADIFKSDFSEVREILRDIQLGANGTVSVTIPLKPGLLPQVLSLDLGTASLVLNGQTETLWIRGEHQGVAFYGTPIEIGASQSFAMEGLIDFGGDFSFVQTVTSKAGVELSHQYTLSNEGITASITGSVEWSAKINYQAGTVSGKAKATFTAQIAIEIDDDGDVHLAGSVSASGKLTARIAGESTTLFSGSIEASVRSRGLRFRFPRGVGSLGLDLF